MDITHIKIDDKHYDVPSDVVARMQEYYETMQKATTEYNRLRDLAAKVRNLQAEYFSSRNVLVLRAAKAAERNLDDYLSGKTAKKEQEAQQAELFR